jgi:hypothetical protein
MNIAGHFSDISQAWYAQDLRQWRTEWAKDAVSLVQMATDIYTLVAGNTGERFEQRIAALLFSREQS